MENIWGKLGGAKFAITIIVIAISSVLAYLGKLDGTQYAALVGGVSSMFMAGNAVSTFGNAKMEAAKRCNPE